jgi:replicative DNA helicase
MSYGEYQTYDGPPAPDGPPDSMSGRMPPENLEAERAVLGSVLILPRCLDDVRLILSTDDFHNVGHQRIWRAMLTLSESSTAIDAVTLYTQLKSQRDLEDIGGDAYIEQLMEAVPHAAHATYYAEIVRQRSIKRNVLWTLTESISGVYNDDLTGGEVLAAAEQKLFALSESTIQSGPVVLADVLLDAFDRINTRINNPGPSGLLTGWADLDSKLGGLTPSEVHIIAARPSMGKTALVCNLADHVAAHGGTVIFFSLEQGKLDLAERQLAIRTGINSRKLASGQLDDGEQETVMQCSAVMADMEIWIDDSANRSVADMVSLCRMRKRLGRLDLIIIDYLQLITPEDRRESREQQISLISRRLKAMAKELQAPVVCLAQLNRALETRDDKSPRMSDLRESGSIEQDADVVMFLNRPEAWTVNARPCEADLKISKNRNGETGTVTLYWQASCLRFRDLAHLPSSTLYSNEVSRIANNNP